MEREMATPPVEGTARPSTENAHALAAGGLWGREGGMEEGQTGGSALTR